MRIYCPTHQKSFPAPRKNPIKCENRAHVLGELDFAGRAMEPANSGWSYCSDCEHFWPSNTEASGAEKCPVCERVITKRYMCHRCYTFTMESDTPADVKNFTMTQDGVPQPGCPACLKESVENAPLHEHLCETLGVTFKTLLSVCPVCEQLIGGAPSFPASAMEYLNKVKAKKKVRFNYENDLLVADDSGEFVLIPNGKEHSIVLPQLIRFTSKQEFYDYYENHFHCEKPAPGEVIILYPAVVNKVEGGWKLKEAGRLAVSTRRPEARKVLPAPPQTIPAPPAADLKVKDGARQELEARGPHTACPKCSTLVKANDMFCWKCGGALGDAPGEAVTRPKPPKMAMPKMAATMLPKTEAPPKAAAKTAAAEKKAEAVVTPRTSLKTTPTRTSILDAAEPEPELSPKERKLGSILLLTLIGIIAFGATLWLVLTLTSSGPSSATTGKDSATGAAQKQAAAPGAQQPAAQQAKAQNPEEDLKALQEKARKAGPDERAKVLEEFDAAEKKYSQDYRFPFERAKLVIGTDARAHNEAFRSLFMAGEKALDNGKSVEMVNNLLREESGDFKRLAKGHKEWNILIDALKNNDKKALKIVIPF